MKTLLIFLCFLLLVACATPYQPMGFDGGYSDMALSRDTYKVSFRGNGLTLQDHVQTFLLRRCAELTIQQGYKYFIILDSNTNADQSFVTTPTTVRSNTSSTYTEFGNVYGQRYGNNISGNYYSNGYGTQITNTTIDPGQTYAITRYATTVIMKMLVNNKKYPAAMDAAVILSNFRAND